MSHYFDPDPSVPSQPGQVTLAVGALTLELTTDRGVFARHAVDPGPRFLLLEAPAPPPQGDLVDLGCGYGPFALALARRSPRATVWAVDVNRRALALTAANARANGADNVRAVPAEDVPPELRFAGIWTNPPVRIGKAALQALLSYWLERLAPDGRAWLVMHKHLGADSLARWLADQGFACERLRSRRGYRLLEVRARTGPSPAPVP